MPQRGTTAEVIASECECSHRQECVGTGCVLVETESAVVVVVAVTVVGMKCSKGLLQCGWQDAQRRSGNIGGHAVTAAETNDKLGAARRLVFSCNQMCACHQRLSIC